MKNKNSGDDRLNQAIKITELEMSNQALQEKLKLLRIQLESQSQFQYAARSLRSRSASLNRSRANLLSSRNFRSTNTLKTVPDNARPTTAKSYDSIYQELNVLQEELENMRQQQRDCISQMNNQIIKTEDSSPVKLKNELDENIELINLKRFSKKQSAQIQTLQSDFDMAKMEIKQLQIDTSALTAMRDNLQSELSKERLEVVKISSEITTLQENNKLLEGQLNDLQIEKATLKKHNEDLLNLSLQKGKFDTSENAYLEQVKALEADLRREVIAKTELLAKVAEAELMNAKIKSELATNLSTISQLQSTTSMLENELEKLKYRVNSDRTSGSRMKNVSVREERVVTPIEDNRPTISEEKHVSNKDLDSRLRICELEGELSQCKELLRVQCNLNSKYKQEMEELQMLFRQNEDLMCKHLENFQSSLQNHQEQLSVKANQLRSNTLHSMLADLRNFFSTKKLANLQDYGDIVFRLLDNYVSNYESTESTSLSALKKDVPIQTFVTQSEKWVQVDISTFETDIISEVSEIDSTLPTEKETSVIFELRIEKANFTSFSGHLKKSSQNNPKVFLTWNFLNDTEHQAYTPTISVTEGVFNCMCQYEGPWSQFLHQYLKENGIRIEIHLVQGDITVRLAETVINTSSALTTPNKDTNFRAEFKNDNIEGDVTGSFILKCDPTLITIFT